MKTSLIISDKICKEAKKESLKTGKSVSEIISQWAMLGYELVKKRKREPKKFKPLKLGTQKIDLTCRKEWMEKLEDDGS